MPTRVILATSALACALIALGVGVANAQPTPAPAASAMPAASATPAASAAPSAASSATPSPSPTPFKLITLNGFADAAFETVAGTHQVRFINGVPSRIFDAATGPFFDSNSGRRLAGPIDFNTSPNLQNANLQATLNGSVFLGLNGVVIKSHGRTNELGFASAIELAYDIARYNLVDVIQASLSSPELAAARAAPDAAAPRAAKTHAEDRTA